MWSPLDSDLIITGSADFFLKIWKISEQSISMPKETKLAAKKIRTKKKPNEIANGDTKIQN